MCLVTLLKWFFKWLKPTFLFLFDFCQLIFFTKVLSAFSSIIGFSRYITFFLHQAKDSHWEFPLGYKKVYLSSLSFVQNDSSGSHLITYEQFNSFFLYEYFLVHNICMSNLPKCDIWLSRMLVLSRSLCVVDRFGNLAPLFLLLWHWVMVCCIIWQPPLWAYQHNLQYA